jgi:hypothetical protein
VNDAWALVMVICGGIITLAGAAGVIWWLVKPRITDWLEDQLVRPMRETHHQVTVNHHSSAEPTILDRLDTLTTMQQAQSDEFESLHGNVADLTGMLLQHLQSQTD